MASPADIRLLDLLEKWLASLELHTKYSSLDDDNYWRIQPWVEHQRPSRWILDLAKQKTAALKSQVESRIEAGDAQFSESLELMIFLANLVGSEHIERFIPVAEMQNERPLTPVEAAESGASGTREMPKFASEKQRKGQSATAANAQVVRAERKTGKGARAASAAPATAASAAKTGVDEADANAAGGKAAGASVAAGAAREQVVADAARLVQWGRKWFELPELVARMAGRPSLIEVRRILKENKAAIEAKAGET